MIAKAALSRRRDNIMNSSASPASTVTASIRRESAPYNSTVVGGGGGASGRATVHKKFVVGLKGLYGEGVGRYGNAQLGDVTIRPNGMLSPLHGFSALSTVELNPNKRMNIYFNYGGDYLGRDYTISGGKQSATASTRPICRVARLSPLPPPRSRLRTRPLRATQPTVRTTTKTWPEFTAGYWFYIHNGPKGGLRQGIQYSNIRRDLWSGAGGTLNPGGGAHGNDNMVFTSFRYYLP